MRMIHRSTLPLGLRLVHVPMPGMRSVTVSVFVGVGSRYETAREAGLAHLIEHMLFKGTHRRPRAVDISATLDAVGGVVNASTDKEVTMYWAKVAREDVPLAVDLLADMLLNSRMSSADFTREKNVVIEELGMLLDDPQDWVHVLADEVLWPGQQVGREVAGTPESVRGLRLSVARAFLRRYYGANNAVVSVAGGIEEDEVIQLVTEAFGSWAGVEASSPAPASFGASGPRTVPQYRPTQQVNLCVTYPGVSRYHPDRNALDVLCTVLGGFTSSRLFVQLREQRGLAYEVQAYSSHLSDTGSVVIYAAMDEERATEALAAIFHEVDRLQRRRIMPAELQRAKQYHRGRLWLGLEDTYAVASWYGAHELLHGDVIYPDEVVNRIHAVTVDDVLRCARTYLAADLVRLAAVGPVSGLGLEARLLGA